jgi:CheY-like chemotaxis protein
MGDPIPSTPRMTTRVLVVDDSPTIRKVVSAVLERHGFEAVEAVDGQAALEKLTQAARATQEGDEPDEAEKIDVVLVDFVMPRMNGFQLCRAIRHDELLRDTPVVLMSAKSDRIREHFVQQTGAIDAITKPFEAQALIAVIENAIRRSTEWRQRERSDRHRVAEPPEATDPLRTTPQDGRPPIALQGDIAIIPIGAVLQLLQIEARSGLLLVTDGRSEVTMAMRRGLIDLVQARGASSEFRLGRYFVEHGLVTTEDIDRLLQGHPQAPAHNQAQPRNPKSPPPESGSRSAASKDEPPTGTRRLLGDLLVESGRVTREQLRDGLARQSSELVYEVLRWPAGRFEFRLDSLPALAETAQLGLPVASVVMEGFRRVDEWRVVEAGLGSFESVLQADPVAIGVSDLERLTKDERRLLDMVDGKRTVRAIIEQSHMSSFDACKVLFQLLEARLVRRRVA